MNVSPMKGPTVRSLWSVDGIILAVDFFGVISVFAATVLLVILLYYHPASGALWLALPLCLAIQAMSVLRVRFDWQRISNASSDSESENRPSGNLAS